MVPICIRKGVWGWTNHSCMVIIHKTYESSVGYRGSKSIVLYSITITVVKEQRVDGNRCFNIKHLRCTLMGFERNYQVKIPSKQVINKRFYSSAVERSLSSKYNLNYLNLNPWFITGFIDAEGSFIISIIKTPRFNTGWEIQAMFSISLHKKDLSILQKIQAYFGGAGSITKEREDSLHYRVRSTLDLTNVIIPHFEKYPLITQKKSWFYFI